MARRRSTWGRPKKQAEPKTLFDSMEMHKLQSAITEMWSNYTRQTAPHQLTFDDIVTTLFTPEALRIARQSKGVLCETQTYLGYPVKMQDLTGEPPSIYLEFEHEPMMALSSSVCNDIPPDSKLGQIVLHAHKTYDEFCKMRYVAEWFNRHATASAVVNYWPLINTLLAGNKKLQATTDRFKSPVGVGAMLHLIRETMQLGAMAQVVGTFPDTGRIGIAAALQVGGSSLYYTHNDVRFEIPRPEASMILI